MNTFNVLILITLVWATCCSGREELVAPEHFKNSLETDKAKFVLGEQILLHYRIDNTGDEKFKVNFGGDYRGTVRSLRFTVTGKDEAGKELEDPYPSASSMCMGGISSSPDVAKDKPFYASIFLDSYLCIDVPGKYTISVYHDLGWGKNEKTRNALTASVQIEIVMPTPDEAEKVVSDLLALPEDHGGSSGQRRKPSRSLASVTHPIYLPALKRCLLEGKTEALASIGQIATPEATLCLIDLVKFSDVKLASEAAGTLNRRLPDPRWSKELEWRGGFHDMFAMDKEGQKLSAASWRPDMAAAVRALALRYLGQISPNDRVLGAYMLQCIGVPEDADALLKGASLAFEQSKDRPMETGFYPRVRGDCGEMVRAIEALLKRGMKPTVDPKTPGEIAAFLIALQSGKDFRPDGWQAKCMSWLASPIPAIRELVLKSIPEAPPGFVAALPKRILDSDVDVQIAACKWATRLKSAELTEPVMKCLEEAKEDWLRRDALEAANALNKPYEMLTVLVKRIGQCGIEEQGNLDLLAERVIEMKHGHSSNAQDLGDLAKLKARWIEFLSKNEPRLRDRNRFKPGEPALTPDLFPGYTFDLEDGKKWP
jgi:hypothetical protein